ncbi:21983_t:CDS:1, partial [Racocetra persica]
MPPTKKVTAFSRAQEFPEDFVVDFTKLMCRFCGRSVNYKNKAYVISHLNLKIHKKNRETYLNNNQSTQQQTLPSAIKIANIKREMVYDLLEAWVGANTPLEKFDKFRGFLVKYCRKDGIIPGSNALRKQYLMKVFHKHIEKLWNEF